MSIEPWTKKFGSKTMLAMQRLEKRAPDMVRRAIIVVDVLKEDPETVVEKVLGSLRFRFEIARPYR